MSTPTTTERPAFYTHFDRHAHGKGLKGATTHYCSGCGHGLIQKFLAESISELGLQDRTVLVSPVGCAVFMYYYLDTGNTQAAHGRAPAVGLGHKMANPDSIVISYQGDGDLASIGMAEIMHAAQLGIPISVIFVNNAIYGMTGGQMAPTTLTGQVSSTTPFGRGRMEGTPLRMAEIIAQLDAPIYVERTAIFNQKGRKATKRAIKKILQLQEEGRGFGFVEVLSECPTHLKMSPAEAEKWVEEEMTKVFPLGKIKDETVEPWFAPKKPSFDAEKVLGVLDTTAKAAERFCQGFPTHLDPDDISLKLAGAGGDGAQTAALLLTQSAINEGFDATHIPSYGPESRGGTSYADVHVAREEVLSPGSPHPHVLVAFNAPSLAKFGPTVRDGGMIIYDSSAISERPAGISDKVTVHGVPCSEIAHSLGRPVVKNVVALGALQEASNILTAESILSAVRKALASKCAMIPMNEEAFEWGARAVREGFSHLPEV
jgi:2-oxoisovalerate ferredoxin oxidoreductase beta subunit